MEIRCKLYSRLRYDKIYLFFLHLLKFWQKNKMNEKPYNFSDPKILTFLLLSNSRENPSSSSTKQYMNYSITIQCSTHRGLIRRAHGEQSTQEIFQVQYSKRTEKHPLITTYFDYYQKIFAPGFSKSYRGPWP